jgi:DNA-binding MarR family transcriptional regulator
LRTVARIARALDALAERCDADTIGCIAVFLCVCEHNGICIKDIVHLCGLSEAKVSRSVESLSLSGGAGLLDVHRHPIDGRKRLVFLSDDGEALRAEMEGLFRETATA